MKVIDYQTTIAWRCPHCGGLGMDKINIFDFSGQQRLEVTCNCDGSRVTIGKKNNNHYWVEYLCLLCETKHVQVYHKQEFWQAETEKIKCPTHKVEVGYLGDYAQIKKLVAEEEEYLKETKEKLKIDGCLEDNNKQQKEGEIAQKSLRKLKKIKILEGVVRALQKPPLKS